MRRQPQQQRNPGVRRERDGRAVRRQLVLLACGLMLAGGFVAAVGQRYAAVRYGYEGETLRAERVRLEAEHERLRLELSEAESPVTLEREARRIGMQPARASQIAASRRPDEQPPAAGASVTAREDSTPKRPAGVRATATAARRVEAASRRENSPDERARIAPRGDTRPRIVEVVKQGR